MFCLRFAIALMTLITISIWVAPFGYLFCHSPFTPGNSGRSSQEFSKDRIFDPPLLRLSRDRPRVLRLCTSSGGTYARMAQPRWLRDALQPLT